MNDAKILLADDDRLIRSTLAMGLRAAGYEVLEAGDGDRALQMCKESPPDLAILDVRMPGLSGIELARRLRAETNIPFLFLSAYGDDDTVERAVAEGALGYLVKPLGMSSMLPPVKAALARAAELKKLRGIEENFDTALHSSQAINLALGQIMEHFGVDREHAFDGLRAYARSQRRTVAEVAADLGHGTEIASLAATIERKR
jgi:DNA-binding response OmpR family regulator